MVCLGSIKINIWERLEHSQLKVFMKQKILVAVKVAHYLSMIQVILSEQKSYVKKEQIEVSLFEMKLINILG